LKPDLEAVWRSSNCDGLADDTLALADVAGNPDRSSGFDRFLDPVWLMRIRPFSLVSEPITANSLVSEPIKQTAGTEIFHPASREARSCWLSAFDPG
jgi:hypothetical protein